MAVLVDQLQYKDSQLQALKKCNHRLEGKVSKLLSQLKQKQLMCQRTADLLSAYNGTAVVRDST